MAGVKVGTVFSDAEGKYSLTAETGDLPLAFGVHGETYFHFQRGVGE